MSRYQAPRQASVTIAVGVPAPPELEPGDVVVVAFDTQVREDLVDGVISLVGPYSGPWIVTRVWGSVADLEELLPGPDRVRALLHMPVAQLREVTTPELVERARRELPKRMRHRAEIERRRGAVTRYRPT